MVKEVTVEQKNVQHDRNGKPLDGFAFGAYLPLPAGTAARNASSSLALSASSSNLVVNVFKALSVFDRAFRLARRFTIEEDMRLEFSRKAVSSSLQRELKACSAARRSSILLPESEAAERHDRMFSEDYLVVRRMFPPGFEWSLPYEW